jgi:hypothetical protein
LILREVATKDRGTGKYFRRKQKDCFSMTHIWCNNSAFGINSRIGLSV